LKIEMCNQCVVDNCKATDLLAPPTNGGTKRPYNNDGQYGQ